MRCLAAQGRERTLLLATAFVTTVCLLVYVSNHGVHVTQRRVLPPMVTAATEMTPALGHTPVQPVHGKAQSSAGGASLPKRGDNAPSVKTEQVTQQKPRQVSGLKAHISIIVVWLGPWPAYMPVYLSTAAQNEGVDFHIFGIQSGWPSPKQKEATCWPSAVLFWAVGGRETCVLR